MKDEQDLLFNSVIEGDSVGVEKIISEALSSGSKARDLLNEGLIRAMEKVGDLFESGEYFIPDMLIAAKAMKAGMAILKPFLIEAGVPSVGRVVIGTIQGDLHDIGKNLVSMMLEGGGFEVVDLGTDVAPEKFAAAVREYKPEVVGMSALLTTTMQGMANAIDAIDDLGMRHQVKIIIGGAPVTHEYAEKIKADGYAPDAIKAVILAKSLLGSKNQ